MKKLTRAGVLVLALALCLSLAACGGEESKTIDINALAEELVNAATFGEPMNALDSSVALGLYGCAARAPASAPTPEQAPPPRRSPCSTAAAPMPPLRS